MSETLELAFGAILIFSLVVLTTVALVYYRQRHACYTNPSPWCHNDWECKDVPEGNPDRLPAKKAQDAAVSCTPNSDGSNPEACTNLWGIGNPAINT